MQFFQCGISSGSHLPLAITCGSKVPAPDAIASMENKNRDDETAWSGSDSILDQEVDSIKSNNSNSKNTNMSNKNNNQNILKSARTYDSLDAVLSPFEEDLALDRNVMYAQHDQDINAKVREILDFNAQTTSINASVKRAAERFSKPPSTSKTIMALTPSSSHHQNHHNRNGRKHRKKELFDIVEELETLSPKQEAPLMRIFCRLQQSERFKVFCFARKAKSLVQLLRGVEDKLMFGVKGDRPGRLLLIVNNRASFSDDFVEIDDIKSIRDEDRFVYIPFVAEVIWCCDEELEKSDLNYSISETVSPTSSEMRLYRPIVQKMAYNSPQYNTVCAKGYQNSHSDPANRHSFVHTKLHPNMRDEFEFLQEQILNVRTSTTSSGSCSSPTVEGMLNEERSRNEIRVYPVSSTKSSFDWSLEETDAFNVESDERQEERDFLRLTSIDCEFEDDFRDAPPEDIIDVLTSAVGYETERQTEIGYKARELKKNRLKLETMEKEFQKSQKSQKSQNSPRGNDDIADRYCQGPFDEVDSEASQSFDRLRDARIEAFEGTSRSRRSKRSDEDEHRHRSPPQSPSRGRVHMRSSNTRSDNS